MEIGDKIRARREELGISQDELAKRVGYRSRSSINKIEIDGRGLPQSKIVAFAKALNTSPAYLMGWIDTAEELRPTQEEIQRYKDAMFPVHLKKFPLLGEIACGQPIFANEDRESYVMAGTNIKADFCLKARGDSMINARINDGDIVFIKKAEDIEDGCIYAIGYDGQVTLKRIYYDKKNNIFQLVAENPIYKPVIITGEKLNHITILGKAVAFQSDVK